jgi:hypothetical protein
MEWHAKKDKMILENWNLLERHDLCHHERGMLLDGSLRTLLRRIKPGWQLTLTDSLSTFVDFYMTREEDIPYHVNSTKILIDGCQLSFAMMIQTGISVSPLRVEVQPGLIPYTPSLIWLWAYFNGNLPTTIAELLVISVRATETAFLGVLVT